MNETGNEACSVTEGLPGWQSIKTAPKDGRRILVVYGGQTRVAQYGKTSHVSLYGFCLADQGPEDFDLVEVKLWQPLPSPPSPEAKP